MSKNLVFIQTTAARLMLSSDAEIVGDLLQGAREMARSRSEMITTLNTLFAVTMHSDGGGQPTEKDQFVMSALALGIARDYAAEQGDDLEHQLEQGNWFIGIKLIYKPNRVVTAYVTTETVDDIYVKVEQLRVQPFIENVDPRAN